MVKEYELDSAFGLLTSIEVQFLN